MTEHQERALIRAVYEIGRKIAMQSTSTIEFDRSLFDSLAPLRKLLDEWEQEDIRRKADGGRFTL